MAWVARQRNRARYLEYFRLIQMRTRLVSITRIVFAFPLAVILAVTSASAADWPTYPENPFIIELEVTAPEDDSAGSLIVTDVDNDGLLDYLVTVPGHLAAYAHDGRKLWILETNIRVGGSSERVGLPGHHGPGLQAGDIDGDARTEVLFLTQDSRLHAVDGASGQEEWTAQPPVPKKAQRWEHLVLASFRGSEYCDLLLQATNAKGYRVGHMLVAYRIENLMQQRYEPLWQCDDFLACAHNGARVADLDGDGMDEVPGGDILRGDGKRLFKIPLKGHIDSIFVNDVRPDIPGLEVIALEEGSGNRVFCYNVKGLIWESHYKHWEPQNAALGDFDPDRPGLEVWCRSRFNEHQKPFIFDAQGKPFAAYEMDHVAPKGWTVSGVEVIHTVDWTGEPKQLAAAKERHKNGDVAVFDPVSGKFLERFTTKANRFYVADVAGDWREELIVFTGSRLEIYQNLAPNPRPDRPRLWERQEYRKSKMSWNYYSP